VVISKPIFRETHELLDGLPIIPKKYFLQGKDLEEMDGYYQFAIEVVILAQERIGTYNIEGSKSKQPKMFWKFLKLGNFLR
jgi:hypothetical protein